MDELHAAALAEVVKKLQAHGGVQALVAGKVYGPEEAPAGLPCVAVTKGKAHPPTPGPNAPTRREVRVECRAADPEVLHLLLVAAARALNGATGGTAFQSCTLVRAGEDEEGEGYVSRRDVYSALCVGRPAAARPPVVRTGSDQ